MTSDDFNKVSKELEKRKYENIDAIIVNRSRSKIANVNQFEHKAIECLGFSTVSCLLFFWLSVYLITPENAVAITNVIPGEVFSYSVGCASLVLGEISRRLVEKIKKSKEKLAEFSKAHTQNEKLIEEISYDIEVEKANNRKQALQRTIDLLESNQSISSVLNQGKDDNFNNANASLESTQQRIEALSAYLKEKYEELDILSTQSVLNEKFNKIRTKGEQGWEILKSASIASLIATFFLDMPLMFLRDVMTYSTVSSVAAILAPIIGGFVGMAGYSIKKNIDYRRAFNSLNSSLGENALPEMVKDNREECISINSKIDTISRAIGFAEAQLYEHKLILESLSSDSESQEHELVQTKDEVPAIEVTAQSIGSESIGFTLEDSEEGTPTFSDGPSLSKKNKFGK